MPKYRLVFDCGIVGGRREDIIEEDKELSEGELAEYAKDFAFNYIEYYGERIDE